MKSICSLRRTHTQLQPRNHPSRNESLIQILPGELIRIILSFYTNTWRETIRFGTICSTWKAECDHSLVWLQFPLSFYAPQAYYDCRITTRNETIPSVITAGNWYPMKVLVHPDNEFNPIAYPSKIYKFEYYQGRQVFQLNPIVDPTKLSIDALPFQEALLARQRFMKFFVEYHRLWAWYIQWHSILIPINTFIEKYLTGKTTERYSLYFVMILQSLAIYLFSSLTNYSSSLTIQNHFGFICLYISLMYYCLRVLMNLFQLFLDDIQSPPKQDLKAPFTMDRYASMFGLLSYLLGIVASLAFLQYSLSYEHSPSIYKYLSIPIWIGAFLAFPFGVIDTSNSVRENDWLGFIVRIGIGIMLGSAFPLTYTLFTFDYAVGNNNSLSSSPSSSEWLWLRLIPLLPIELLALVMTLSCVTDSYELWKSYLRREAIASLAYREISSPGNEYYCSLPMVRLMGNGVKTVFACFSFGVLIYFNVLIAEDQLDLSYAFMLPILCFVLVQCGAMGANFDCYYL